MTKRHETLGPFIVALWVMAGCSDDAAPSWRGPRPEEVPAAVEVAGSTVEVGFALGKPREETALTAYRISRTPTTVAEYKMCIDAKRCAPPELRGGACSGARPRLVDGQTFEVGEGGALPVTCVSPRQAGGYCAWLGATLPTFAQWLYAARGPEVRRFVWGGARPTCDQHPGWGPSDDGPGQCCAVGECGATFFSVGRRLAASPSGVQDVLLTPAELLVSTGDSAAGACKAAEGHCAVSGLEPGAIDSLFRLPGDPAGIDQQQALPAYGFRCVWRSPS